jgi:hypothetical protein
MNTKKVLVCGLIAVMLTLAFVACESPIEPAHVHDYEWTVTTPATCIATGEETGICKLDPSHTTTREIAIDPTAHDWGEWEGTVTCTEAGTGTRVCSRNETHIETNDNLQPLGHNYEYEETTAPTCTTAGEETGTCIHDATHTTTRSVTALGHDYQNWQKTTAATCTTEGEETGICTHDVTHTATRAVAIDPTAHDYEWKETTAPTCETAGEETGICTHNASHTTTHTGAAALEHNWKWQETIPATTTTEGLETETCSRCGVTNRTHSIHKIFTSIDDITTFLETNNEGANINDSIMLPLQIDLGNMTNTDSGWRQLLEIIAEANKYVRFDLSNCITDSSEFNPDYTISTGKDKIIEITLPVMSTSITDGIPSGWPYTATFEYFNNLRSVSGAGIVTIGVVSFYNKARLTELNFPVATNINLSAFLDCTGLIKVNFPEVTVICDNAFYWCTNLIEINFPKVTEIGYGAFENCKLTEVNLILVTNIGGGAFARCNYLIKVTLGTITEANFNIFSTFLGNLRNVYFDVGGGAGTYIRESGSDTWTKQP